jgi:hypothetical protein
MKLPIRESIQYVFLLLAVSLVDIPATSANSIEDRLWGVAYRSSGPM